MIFICIIMIEKLTTFLAATDRISDLKFFDHYKDDPDAIKIRHHEIDLDIARDISPAA